MVNALLAEELATRHEVAVLTSRGLGLPAESREGGVRILRVPVFFRGRQATANMPSMFAYLPMGYLRGRRLLARERFDVINTHFVLPSGPVGHRLSRSAGIPNVLSVHGGDLYDPSKWTSPHRHAPLRLWIRRLLLHADAVVGQSRNTIENAHRFYAREVEASRIPLGIRRPPQNGAAERAAYRCAPDDVLLVTVGRLVARKGLGQLVTLMRDLAAPRIRLLIMGSGPERAPLESECSRLGLADRVCFLGRIEEEEKFRVLRMCDAFVSTSQHEGFGLVFLEAMACGLPVVCYDHGGQTDFLASGETGYLVPLNDLARFRESCETLARNAELRRTMGEENLRRVEELFIDACAARYEGLFESVLAGRAAEPARA